MFENFRHQFLHIPAFDSDAENQFRNPIRARKIDLCLAGAGYMHMRRIMIESVNHEAVAMGTVDDDHDSI